MSKRVVLQDRNLSVEEVAELVGLSRATIYAMLKPGMRAHAPSFPKQFPIGKRRVAWSERAVRNWIAKQRGEDDVRPVVEILESQEIAVRRQAKHVGASAVIPSVKEQACAVADYVKSALAAGSLPSREGAVRAAGVNGAGPNESRFREIYAAVLKSDIGHHQVLLDWTIGGITPEVGVSLSANGTGYSLVHVNGRTLKVAQLGDSIAVSRLIWTDHGFTLRHSDRKGLRRAIRPEVLVRRARPTHPLCHQTVTAEPALFDAAKEIAPH